MHISTYWYTHSYVYKYTNTKFTHIESEFWKLYTKSDHKPTCAEISGSREILVFKIINLWRETLSYNKNREFFRVWISLSSKDRDYPELSSSSGDEYYLVLSNSYWFGCEVICTCQNLKYDLTLVTPKSIHATTTYLSELNLTPLIKLTQNVKYEF